MSLSSGSQALLWVDLETTGTDEDKDPIIEVGAIITDFNFKQVGTAFTGLAHPSPAGWGRLMTNDVVRKMHTDNGLIDDLVTTHKLVLWQVENRLLEWIDSCMNPEQHEEGRGSKEYQALRRGNIKLLLAGSGVGHFDRRFINKQMPELAKLLAFPVLDIGVVRRYLRFCDIQIPSEYSQYNGAADKDHRALADIVMHLEEARAYKSFLGNLLRESEDAVQQRKLSATSVGKEE